jgi:tellurite resistance protein TehA-like permease
MDRFGAETVRRLYPGYFALVMATGIVSTGLRDVGRSVMSAVLLVIAMGCFAVLAIATTVRVICFPREVLADLSSPDQAYVFFTFVAACGVLGDGVSAEGAPPAAAVLGGLGLFAWLGLSYGIPLRLILGSRSRPVLADVNGTWFMWAVGTQSLAVIAAVLGSGYPGAARLAGLVAVVMWSVGVLLYLIVAVLVLLRLLLLDVRPEDLTPPYWITMGATAISVLAAGQILRMPPTPAITAARPVITGLAVLLWAFGTWLIPMLVLFGLRRYGLERHGLQEHAPRGHDLRGHDPRGHDLQGHDLRRHAPSRARPGYRPQLWSVVFPLGMYAVAGMEFGRAAALPIIEQIGRVWVWVAFPVWAITFAAMLGALLRSPARYGRRPG